MLCGGSVNGGRRLRADIGARLSIVLTLVGVLALVWAASSRAAGGDYVFDGGTAAQHAEVRAALDASSFDWGRVPRVTIHVAPGQESEAVPHEIWLDADLLNSGRFAWGIIQHEYAHEVDYLLLSDPLRASLGVQLGAREWYPGTGLAHDEYGCERFASTLAWAYWPSAANSLKPDGPNAESGAMEPASFRALMTRLLGVPNSVAAFRAARPPRRH